jgi:hypothetical protein
LRATDPMAEWRFAAGFPVVLTGRRSRNSRGDFSHSPTDESRAPRPEGRSAHQ